MMKYQPINCDFYDKLEAYATFKTPLTIIFMHETNFITIENVLIVTLFTKNHEEFMVLDNGQTIRLDKLQRINGETIPNAC